MNFLERIMVNAYAALPPWKKRGDRQVGRELEELRTGDHSSVDRAFRALFKSYEPLPPLTYFNVAGRACTDLAPHYQKAPRRTLPATVSEVERAKIEALWKRHPARLETEQACVAQQCYFDFVHLDQTGTKTVVTPVLGYQVIDIEWPDALGPCDDLREARRVRFAVTLLERADSTATPSPFVATVDLSTEYAVMIYPNGRRQPLLAADGSNPLGYLPLAGRRRSQPADRVLWTPPPAYDLQSGHVGAVCGYTDVTAVIRQQIPGLLSAVGPGAKRLGKELRLSPGAILPSESEDIKIGWIQSQPPTEKYTAILDRSLELFENLRYLPSGSLTGVTGAAKDADTQPLYDERARQEQELIAFEGRRTDILIDVSNLLPEATKITPGLGSEVSVQYVYPQARQNVLQEAQAMALAASYGMISVVEEVARREGLASEDAARVVAERIAQWRDLVASQGSGSAPTPGMDRLAAQVAKPLTGGAGASEG